MDGSREDATVRWSPSPCRRSRLDLNYTALFLPADRPINLLQRQQANSNVVSTHRPQRRRAKLTCTRIMVPNPSPRPQRLGQRSPFAWGRGLSPSVVATRCPTLSVARSDAMSTCTLWQCHIVLSLPSPPRSLLLARQWPARNASICAFHY